MSLADRIASRTRQPTMTAYLDGRRWRGALTASVGQEYQQSLSGGTITGRNPPVTPVTGMSIRWTWGYDGYEVPGFRGYVVTPEISSYPNVWSLEVADVLWPAQREEQTIVTSPLNDITAQDAIEYILATYGGNPSRNIPSIPRPSNSATAWTLGQETPVRWERTTALAACVEICQAAGYYLFADAGGTVRARFMERKPSDSAFRTFQRGLDLLVSGAPRRRQDGNAVKNQTTVLGANTGIEGAQIRDVFLATHALTPGVVSEQEYSSFLIEFVDDATAIASRLTGQSNRRPNTISGRLKADPRLAVGTTVAIQDSAIGYSSAQKFFIFRLQTTIDLQRGAFDQDIVLDGGLGDSGFSTIPPPVAVLAYTLEKENLNGTPSTIVELDGSGSTSPSGVVVAWNFSTSSTVVAGTPTGSTSPHAANKFQLVFPDTSSPVTVSLTVTDTSSKTDTVELTIDLASDPLAVREAISVAFGSVWEITPDGGTTWRSATDTITRVPPIGASVWDTAPAGDSGTYGALASGGTDLLRTLDLLTTAPTTLNTASGTITALAVNTKNGARVWRAVGDTVQRSTDGGATWTTWGQPLAGTNVVDLLEDPAVENSIFALAGNTMWHSTSSTPPGTSWSSLYVGPVGATARWLARSEDGAITWICYTGSFTGSPVQRVEGGIGVTFPVVSPVVSEIRAIALSDMIDPAAPTLTAVDQEGRLWTIDGLTGLSPTQSTDSVPAGTIVQHALHSREIAMTYLATFDNGVAGTGAVYKHLTRSDALLLFRQGAAGQQAHMVGHVRAGVIAVPVTIYITTLGESGAEDRLWKYDITTGTWVGITYPQSGWFWHDFKVDPFNDQRMLLLGNNVGGAQQTSMSNSGGTVRSNNGAASPLYLSEDGGATWTPIDLTGLTSTPGINAVYWSASAGGTFYTAANTAAGTPSYFWRGTVGSTSFAAAVTSSTRVWTFSPSGQSGDAVVTDFGGGREIGYINAANTLTEPAGSSAATGDYVDIDVLPSSRLLVALANSELVVAADYRAAQPGDSIAITPGTPYTYKAVAITADGSVYVPTTNGVAKISSITGTPLQELIYPFAAGTFRIATDKQTRTVIVAGQGDGSAATNLIVFDGVNWSVLAGPSFTVTLFGALEAVVA